MREQIISEIEVARHFRMTALEDMRMMGSPFFIPLDKEPSPGHPILALWNISVPTHHCIEMIDSVYRPDFDQDINDGLGANIRNRGAPDVMNSQHLRFQNGPQPIGLFMEAF